MSLKEEMQRNRMEKTSITEQELQEIMDKVKVAFKEWQEMDVDKICFLFKVKWDDEKLILFPEGGDASFCVIEGVESKSKQDKIMKDIEENLGKEGIEPDRKGGEVTWAIYLQS